MSACFEKDQFIIEVTVFKFSVTFSKNIEAQPFLELKNQSKEDT